ncbi:MAG: hypothetical protein V1720_09170 [bacterium]
MNDNFGKELQLLQLFEELRISNTSLTPSRLKELIDYSSQIALKFLNYKYQSDRAKFLNLGYSFADIAVEAIVPLFIENKSTKELGIIKSLNDWQSPLETEEQLQYFVNKLVVNRVEQELIRIYKEADPFFAKIHDSIEYIIEQSGYVKKSSYGTMLIFKSADANGEFIPAHEFDKLPDSFFFGKIKTIVQSILKYLESETGFISAIPLNLLIKRIKHAQFSNQYINYSTVDEHPEEKIIIGKIISAGLGTVYSKIDGFYKEKLSVTEKQAFKDALNEISIDLTDGGIPHELFAYLNKQMPDLNKSDYYGKYHSIFDYLLRLMKKQIAAEMQNEGLFSNQDDN